jgi:phage baseplate assembly protein W
VADADLGTDVTLVSDLAPVWGVSDGFTNLAAAIARRLDTERGSLFYAPDYGMDLKAYLNQDMSEADMSALQGAIASEIEKDPRVNSCTAVVTRGSLDVAMGIETDDGPFDLVVRPTDLTIELLKVGAGGAAAAPAAAPVIVTVKGDKGDPGIPGTAGGGGSSGESITLDDTAQIGTSTGAEEVLFEWSGVDFDDLPASLTARLSADLSSASGTALFKLRVGGTTGVADGTLVLTISTASAGLIRLSSSASIAGLTGVQFVKVTGTSSGAAVDAKAQAPVVTFR